MGCTSSKSTVVATNIRRNSEKPSTLAGKTKDANNNDAGPDPRAVDEISNSQKNLGNEVLRNKDSIVSESKRIEVSESQRRSEDEGLEKHEDDGVEDIRHSKDDTKDQSKNNQLQTDTGKNGSSLLIVAENEKNAGLSLSSSSHDSNEKSKIVHGEEKLVKKIGKFQLFSSVDEFKDVDLHALQVGYF